LDDDVGAGREGERDCGEGIAEEEEVVVVVAAEAVVAEGLDGSLD
jgi:hypothetical protein